MSFTSSSTSIATIPDVTVAQLIGSEPVPLAYGPLTLEEVDPTPTTSTSNSDAQNGTTTTTTSKTSNGGMADPILLLRVGEKILFPLYTHTIFGTHADQETWYTFDLPLPDVASSSSTSTSTSTTATTEVPLNEKNEEEDNEKKEEKKKENSWVRLVFPPLSTPELLSARDQFENVLIKYKLLFDGARAVGDELGSSALQTGKDLSTSLSQASKEYTSTTPNSSSAIGEKNSEDGDWKFSRSSHRSSEGVLAGSKKLSEATGIAAQAVQGLAQAAGGALGSAYQGLAGTYFGGGGSDEKKQTEGQVASTSTSTTKSQEEEQQQQPQDDRYLPNTRDAFSSTFQGTKEGISSLYGTATTEAPRVIQHDMGEEAAKLAQETGQTLANTGQAALDLTLGTSSVFHGVQAAKGAAANAGSDSNGGGSGSRGAEATEVQKS